MNLEEIVFKNTDLLLTNWIGVGIVCLVIIWIGIYIILNVKKIKIWNS